MRVRLLLHLEGENSKLGRLFADEYIFHVQLCQDLLMDKVSEQEKIQRAQNTNKTVGHVSGAKHALHVYQTWNKNTSTATRR